MDDLVHLTIQQRDQIRNDISLIADLDENCFRFAHKREEINKLKKFIDSLEDIDKVKQKDIDQYKKLLEDKKEELNNKCEEVKKANNELAREAGENRELTT